MEFRCHRVGPPGEISSPEVLNGLRKFSPPGDFVRSYFQGLGSAPRAKPPGMRTRVSALCADITRQNLTFQGHRLIKDINSSRTSKDYIFSTLQGLQRTTSLFAAIKDIDSQSQGQQLFKDIESTTRTTSTLQGLHYFTAITLILLWPQYRSMMTFCDTKRALQTNTDLALARMKKEI